MHANRMGAWSDVEFPNFPTAKVACLRKRLRANGAGIMHADIRPTVSHVICLSAVRMRASDRKRTRHTCSIYKLHTSGERK